MKVLGIDPGTRIVGYGVVEERNGILFPCCYGAIKTKSTEPLQNRLKEIYEKIIEIIEEHEPDCLATEKVFYGKNIQSAIRIGESRGVILLAAAKSNIEFREYDATKIKKSVVGTGKAHKTQVQSLIKVILNLDKIPNPTDISDALAISICHFHYAKWENL